MLKSQYRLKKNYQFNYIYKKGASVPSKHLVLIFAKSRNTLKIGFSVSNKIGKAVIRNKVKRRLRSIVATLFAVIPQKYNYVFIARNGIDQCDYATLMEEVRQLLHRAEKKML